MAQIKVLVTTEDGTEEWIIDAETDDEAIDIACALASPAKVFDAIVIN